MKKVSLSLNVLGTMIDYIEATQAFINKQAESEERVNAVCPHVASAVIEHGLADPIDRDDLIKKLADHSWTLEALREAAKHVRPAPMGEPEKSASVQYYGQSAARESDRIWEATFGG